jgi:hypothetical protein
MCRRFWQHPDGTRLSFEDWKAYRRRCITDIMWFGNFVLGKDFQPEPHGRWAEELFPKLEPALLSLPEKFGQKDIAKAFRALSEVRQRCLISARSSYKSTFSTVFMLATMLCFAGSLRILVCTATQPLAKGFAKSFKSMLTLRDQNAPTLFNQLWPEHCIAPDEGKSLEYTSPFRQLDVLIEPTLFITSVISEGQAGSRYDLAVMDDCAEISNSSTPEMRAKTQERLDFQDSLRKACMLRNLPVPWFRFVPVSNVSQAKVLRVKTLELPLADGRLWFSSGNPTLEAGLTQLEIFDGVTKSNSHRHDDWADSLGLCWSELGPKYRDESPTEDLEKRRQDQEEEAARERKRFFYDRMFSGSPPQRAPQPVTEEQPQQPTDPRMVIFGKKPGPWRL